MGEYTRQVEIHLSEAAEDSAVAQTDGDRERVRDKILIAQVYATLVQAKATYIVAEQMVNR